MIISKMQADVATVPKQLPAEFTSFLLFFARIPPANKLTGFLLAYL